MVFERYFTHGNALLEFCAELLLQSGETVADRSDLRIGEHHANHAAAQAFADVGKAACIFAGNLALVGRFMQQRQLVGRIAGNENVRHAGLHGARVGNRHAARIAFNLDIFQTDIIDIRAAAGGSEQIVRHKHAAFAVVRPFHFYFAVCIERDLSFGIQVQRQLCAENFFGLFGNHGVGNTADGAAHAENFHAHVQAFQCLAQFQTNHARAEHGNAFRQRVPREHVVVHDAFVAQGFPLRENGRARTGGDDDAVGVDLRVVVNLHGVFVQQARVAHDAFAFVPSQHVFHHEADKTVAFCFHTRHDFLSVHLHGIFVQMYAERVGVQCVVTGFCGGNQQF